MRNKKERELYVRNLLSWETKESTVFTRTLQLEYKGAIWIKIQHREWSTYYDHDFRKLCHKAEWIDKGFYTINELYECLEPTTMTEMVQKISEMDKSNG